MYNDNFLHGKLEERRQQNAFRYLRLPAALIDFCSNDYLGINRNNLLRRGIHQSAPLKHGSGGSRLLTGNYPLIEETEHEIARFHQADAALIFNSGYDANVGLLSCVPQKGDTILYDQLIHASIRDGIRLSFAHAHAFIHNDVDDLGHKLECATGNIFVVTESVFSMDGDIGALHDILQVCERYGAHLILDEAHAIGVIGKSGEGLAQSLNLHERCFARVYTFGKAAGCHGAAVLGSVQLRDYLVNFSRSFIFSTALPESAVAAIQCSYSTFSIMHGERSQLQKLVRQFQQSPIPFDKLHSSTPIQGVLIPGNNQVKHTAELLRASGFDVRPILYPSVAKGKERLRIILHAYNTVDEVKKLVNVLGTFKQNTLK